MVEVRLYPDEEKILAVIRDRFKVTDKSPVTIDYIYGYMRDLEDWKIQQCLKRLEGLNLIKRPFEGSMSFKPMNYEMKKDVSYSTEKIVHCLKLLEGSGTPSEILDKFRDVYGGDVNSEGFTRKVRELASEGRVLDRDPITGRIIIKGKNGNRTLGDFEYV